MVTIKNEFITAQFNEVGAELKSLFCNDREYMWPGHPEVWTGTSPIMFPICSGLKEDKYILNGKEYTLQKHGFARFKTFEVENKFERVCLSFSK